MNVSVALDSVVEVVGVRKSFGKNVVLNGVDLSVPQGAVVGLLGTNGAGKTTLMQCLVGLLQVDAGHITMFGEDPWTLSTETKTRFGYVPQGIKLYPWMKAWDVAGYTGAFYPHWDESWARELFDRWEIDPDKRVATMSTGQLQKLALVLALGHRPELLLLDEPVASLDPRGRREFLRSLVEVTQDAEHTVLFSTHITSDLERVASHVAFLKDGQINVFGELDALKDRVKRLRITADRELPASFSVDGALRVEISGRSALLAVPMVDEALVSRIREDWHADVTVEDLNLEEIFLEMHDA